MEEKPLPPLNPDFDNPTPIDAPSMEQTQALKLIYQLSLQLPHWLAVAATGDLPARRWREIIMVLSAPLALAMKLDTDPITEYQPPQITIYPHEVEPDGDGELCGRCGLAIGDSVHDP